jgi:DNA invertase Pin-like site-specific DNA recombinase
LTIQACLRVSTDRQGKSGLGLEAQREAVKSHLNGGSWELLGEYVEVESDPISGLIMPVAGRDSLTSLLLQGMWYGPRVYPGREQ